jgi:hypothetical protein
MSNKNERIEKLVKKPEYIKTLLVEKDNMLYTKASIIIEFPKWYEEKKLLNNQNGTFLFGVFAIISKGQYSVSLVPAFINTAPLLIKEVERSGEIYTQFLYGKDSCVISNLQLIKDKVIGYDVIENFFIRAYVPWFIGYEDLVRIIDNIKKYAGSDLGDSYISTELLVSFVARSYKDKKLFYRQNDKNGLAYINMLSPYYSTLNTVSKLAGGYFTENLISALVDKEKSTTMLEEIVRK